jgi:predicted O-methyltransferase YrrM
MNIIDRLRNRIVKEFISRQRKDVPFQKNLTYVEDGNQWYDPIIGSPEIFNNDCTSKSTLESVKNIIEKLNPDEYLLFLLKFYSKGVDNFKDDWSYADILTVLYSISSKINVEEYLEIGVRRGRSLSIVASNNPNVNIVGFDLWIENYAGMDNPGPDFVSKELDKVNFKGKLELISGNSRVTVPKYLNENPDKYFDLVTIDGDHSTNGAKLDIKNVIKRVKIGGLVVFDDIDNPNHRSLKKLWYKTFTNSSRYSTFEFEGIGLGVGFAIKLY